MGDWIKRAALLAIVAFGAWKGYQRWQRGSGQHQVVFRAEGPSFCQVGVRFAAGDDARPQQQTTLPWRSDALTVAGSAELSVAVEVPLSCHFQADQVRCLVERDGAPWREATARIVTNPSDGAAQRLQCDLSAVAGE